jgi:nondiscriminating glutamyl-tRNA synthetase
MNGQYIRKLPLDTLVTLVEPYMPPSLHTRYSDAQRREIIAILQDSMDLLSDFGKRAAIFEPEVEYEPETKTLLDSDSARKVLAAMVSRLSAHGGPVTPENFKEMILATGQEVALKGKDLYFPIRGAMTGSVHGPDLTRVAAVKGRDAVLNLLQGAMQ